MKASEETTEYIRCDRCGGMTLYAFKDYGGKSLYHLGNCKSSPNYQPLTRRVT